MFKIVPTHLDRNLIEACCDILNDEWPRSKTARMHMLEKSCDSLPYNLALVERPKDVANIENIGERCSNNELVIGHSRLCKVHSDPNACFVESVVIRKDRRGKGLGRVLMEETELAAKRLGFDVAYLTTRDKQDFYAHIGYEYCEPIISLGSASKLLSDEHFKCLFGKSKENSGSNNRLHSTSTNEISRTSGTNMATGNHESKHEKSNVTNNVPSFVPPPPPLSLKPSINNKDNELKINGEVFWMKKIL